MKKVSVALSLILAFMLCLPSFSVNADNSYFLGYYTTESTSGFFTGSFGNIDLATQSQIMFPVSNQFIEDNLSRIESYTGPYNGTNRGYLLVRNGSNINIYVYSNNVPDSPTFCVYYNQHYYFVALYSSGALGLSYKYNTGTDWSTNNQNSMVQTNVQYDSKYFYIYDLSTLQPFGFSNIDAYLDCTEFVSLYPSTTYPVAEICKKYLEGNEDNFTNYYSEDLPYFDGTQIIDPSPELTENNSNHMYFNSCQLGFCEPYGVSNFSSFGGAYFYAKYSVDEWVRNHITDYSLYFYATAYVDSHQYSGHTEVRLDNDGCITVPFSDIFSTDGGVVSDGFLAYISPNLVEQSFYDTSLYSVNKELVQSFVDQRNISSQDDWDRFWQDLYAVNSGQPVGNPGLGAISYLSSNFSALLNGTISPSIINLINNHTNFKIHVNCYLKDNSGNVSGNVGKMFDLKVGNNYSTNNDGLTNNDPFIETDLPTDYIPSIISDDNGYSLSDIGNNNQIVNFSSPDQIKLFIYSGLEEFITWYNSDPSTAEVSTGFWNTFGLFRNNPAADLYEAYFGFLPVSFKDIILGCATIGIVGGVFCALRRKFT